MLNNIKKSLTTLVAKITRDVTIEVGKYTQIGYKQTNEQKLLEICFSKLAKSRCKAATNLWADTDEEDNADSIDEDAQVETDEDQVRFF